MIRFIYIFIASLFLMIACQDEIKEESVTSLPEGLVTFSADLLQTRGEPILLLSELSGFNVLAFQHADLWENVSATAPATVLMDHVSVLQTADNSWEYSPLMHWPKNENVSFFAYAPKAGTDSVPNQNGLLVSTPLDGLLPVISYTVPATVEDQPDLLVCTSQNYNLNYATDGKRTVDMQLSHALTCVGFKATGEGESIITIKLSGVIGTGTITLGEPSVVWDTNPADTTYTFEAGVNGEALDAVSSNILNGNGYLMMIPQDLTDQAKLTITIDGGNVPYEQTFNLNIPGNNKWQAGQFVEYQFAVSPTGSIIITPESLVLPSAERSFSSFNIICPIQNPNAAWTVNAPDGGWLEIYDSPSGSNQLSQITPYTYSGNGSQTLFAYAPAANNSSSGLVSYITLDGTTESVAVTQLYKDEIYVPKFPHDGWAGSNIYWVPDNAYPAGGYLTFDDKGVTTHEQYQGVYFMWGSLVALSPMGNNWTGGLLNNGGGQILYIPSPDPVYNGGWNPVANSEWGYIPRLGWTNVSNPAGGGSALSLTFNDEQSYLIQNHSPSTNVGDICKFITDMGWAPGAKEGRKWRMPTHIEYLEMNDYVKVGIPFVYQPSNNPYGQMEYSSGFRRQKGNGTPFFPASGFRRNTSGNIFTFQDYRPGEAFSYWTSSPRVANGDAFDYIGINGAPTNVQGFLRDYGSTVRCVMESD